MAYPKKTRLDFDGISSSCSVLGLVLHRRETLRTHSTSISGDLADPLRKSSIHFPIPDAIFLAYDSAGGSSSRNCIQHT